MFGIKKAVAFVYKNSFRLFRVFRCLKKFEKLIMNTNIN